MAFLAVDIDSVTGVVFREEGEVQVAAVLELEFLLVVGELFYKTLYSGVVAVTAVGHKLAVDAQHGGQTFGQMDVGGAHIARFSQQLMNGHRIVPFFIRWYRLCAAVRPYPSGRRGPAGACRRAGNGCRARRHSGGYLHRSSDP